MEYIDFKYINFRKLKCFDSYGNEAELYHDNNKVYKLYKTQNTNRLEIKKQKVECLSNLNIDHVITDFEGIEKNSRFCGITMKYIPDAKNLYSLNVKDHSLANILVRASNTMESLHKNNVILCDCNFENIIYDKNDNYYFIDMDGSILNNIISYQSVPSITNQYFKIIKNNKFYASKNIDRLTFLLSYVYEIFNGYNFNVENKMFLKKMEEYPELEKMQPILKKTYDITEKNIPYIPYFYEFFDNKLDKTKKLEKK